MLAQTLSIIDILAGIAIAGQMHLGWNPITWLGIIMLIKAIYSIITSIATHFYFDWIGWIDLLTGAVILMDLAIPWFFLVPLAKGVYSLIMIKM